MLRRELAADPDGQIITGLALDQHESLHTVERAPAWGKLVREDRRPYVRFTDSNQRRPNDVEDEFIAGVGYVPRASANVGGIFWCSHCALWRPFEEGAADDEERGIGPICDTCWSIWSGTGRWDALVKRRIGG